MSRLSVPGRRTEIMRHNPCILSARGCTTTLVVGFFFIGAVKSACNDDIGCSLNGVCTKSGSCECDQGWYGTECELLDLSPAPPGGAYGYTPNISSWGAHVVYLDGDYHMYVSEFWG